MNNDKDLKELIDAAKEMVEAYTLSYENKWMADNGWGVSKRKDWQEDQRVLDRLQKAIEKVSIKK